MDYWIAVVEFPIAIPNECFNDLYLQGACGSKLENRSGLQHGQMRECPWFCACLEGGVPLRLVHCVVDLGSSSCRPSGVQCLPETCVAHPDNPENISTIPCD